MVTNNIINGSLKSADTGKDKGSKDITNKSNAKDHGQDEQKHCTKGKSKNKGKDNMDDNDKNFPE